MKNKVFAGNEKGFVLILALVTMVAMTLIGISVVMNMTTDMQLARNDREAKIAFQLADAGINEAISRIHLQTTNARYVGEPAGSNYANRNLAWTTNFTSADGLNYQVQVRFLGEGNTEGFCDSNSVENTVGGLPAFCNQTPEEVVMYGKDFNITLTQVQRGRFPVYRFISTGTVNNTSRTVEAYVGGSSLNTDPEAGINTNSTITWNGGDCATSVAPANSCKTTQTNNYNTFLGEDISAIKEMADERHQCSTGTCSGAGDDIPANGQLDTVVGDWGDVAGNSYSTLVYVNNSAVGAKDVKMTGLSGRGILVVTGNLELAGSLNYEGLIYVFGTLTLSGGGADVKNVTGGIMAQNVVTLNGANLQITYDQATLQDVAKQHSSQALLIWKRL